MTSPAPWSEQAAAALAAGPLRHLTAVHLAVAETTWKLPVDARTPIEIVFDETWAPHAQISATTRLPEDPALAAALDARTPARLQIAAGYVIPQAAATDLHPLADVAIRTADATWPTSLIQITAASDEAKLQDTINQALHPIELERTGLAELATAHIRSILPAAAVTSHLPPGYGAELLTEATWAPGQNAWEVLASLADDADCYIRDDGAGTWHILPRPLDVGPAAAILATGPGGTILNARQHTDRAALVNELRLTSKWKDPTGTQREVTATAAIASGPLAPAAAGKRASIITRDTPSSAEGIKTATTALLRRLASRALTYEITAKACYWIRPGATITVELPGLGQVRHLVTRAAFHLPAGLMTLTTRKPLDAPITVGD